MSENKLPSAADKPREFQFGTETDQQMSASDGHVLVAWVNSYFGGEAPIHALRKAFFLTAITTGAAFATGNLTLHNYQGVKDIIGVYSKFYKSDASQKAIASAKGAIEGYLPADIAKTYEEAAKNWAFDPTNKTALDDGRFLHAKYYWASKTPKSDASLSGIKALQDMRDIQLSLLRKGIGPDGKLVSAETVREKEKENEFDTTVWVTRLNALYDNENRPAVVTFPANGLFKDAKALEALSTTGLLALTSDGFFAMGFVDGALTANYVDKTGKCTWIYGAKLDQSCETAFPYVHYPEFGDPIQFEEQTAVLNELKATVYGPKPVNDRETLIDRVKVSEQLALDARDNFFMNVPRHSEKSLTAEQWSKLLQTIDRAFRNGADDGYFQSGAFDGVIAQNLRQYPAPLEVGEEGFFKNSEALRAMGETGAVAVGANSSRIVSAYVDGRLSTVIFNKPEEMKNEEGTVKKNASGGVETGPRCMVIYGDNGGIEDCKPGVLSDGLRRELGDMYGELPKEAVASTWSFESLPKFPADKPGLGVAQEAVDRTLKFAFKNYAKHKDQAREWVVENDLPVKPEIIRENSFLDGVQEMATKAFITLPRSQNGFYVSAYIDGEFSLYGVAYNDSYEALAAGEQDEGLKELGINQNAEIATCYTIVGKPLSIKAPGVQGLKNGVLNCPIGYHHSFNPDLRLMLKPVQEDTQTTNQ